LRIIDRDGLDIQFDPMPLPDHLAGASHNRQRGETQKIDLQQTQGVQDLHLELGHRPDWAFFVVPTCGPMQGDIFNDGLIRDDDPGGMGTGVTDHALQLAGRVDKLGQVGRRLIEFAQPRNLLKGLRDGHGLAWDAGDHLRHPVHLRQRDIKHASHIPDGGTRTQRAKGDDLGYLIAAIFPRSVFEHDMPLVILEIKVDVRHRNAVGVEETLEDQPIFKRVDQGDAQRVGDNGAGRGSARVVPDALFLGIAAEIPHDQEIGVEAHFMNNAQLIVQALAQRTVLRPAAVARPQPLLT